MADQAIVFISEGQASLRLVIPRKGKTAAETKTFNAARKALGDKVVQFRPVPGGYRRGQALVTDKDVAAAVRLLAGKSREHYKIHQDLKLLKIRCPYCDYTRDTNLESDQQALAAHIADAHVDELLADDAAEDDSDGEGAE